MSAPIAQAEQWTRSGLQAWERRRPAWTRTDTARWLDDRSAAVLAWVRRRGGIAPSRNAQAMGLWLQRYLPTIFARAHQHLEICGTDSDKRARLHLLEVLS